MIRKKSLRTTAIATKVEYVVDEITTYIDNLNRRGNLSPEDFSNTVLLIAELLPLTENQDLWVDLGYRICKHMKEIMESYGCNHETDMFGGLGYQCFSINAFCKESSILQNFANSVNKVLFWAVKNRLNQIKNLPTYDSNYDMISGISGNLYYLLDCDYTQEEENTVVECIEYLLSLTKDTVFEGKDIVRFHILQPNQNPNFDQDDLKKGSINFGLAHGMLGPLLALSKAYSRGFQVDGLREGIENIYHLYELFKSSNREDVPYWPGTITVEEYWNGICRPEHLHRPCSWCYGNAGILRGLQKVASYMNWSGREQIHVEAMKRFLSQDVKAYDLFSPSLCHGFSSLVAIQTCAYAAYGDPGLLTNLERNVQKVIAGYQKNNEREFRLMDIRDGTIWIEGYLKDLSLLTGSTGIAITLLSLRGKMKTGKLLMID